MNSIQPAISACGEGQHGIATSSISIAGSTGRVTNVNVTGQFAGTPIGSCIARAVRSAHFNRFKQETFTVMYPFRL